ncbi:MAG: hypothetical protein AAGK92_09775 [Pseudomonadota bacterium]
MKQIVAALALSLTLTPATAQESDVEEGFSLMERGAQMLFEGLMQEMQPRLDQLEDMTRELEPKFRDLMSKMGPALADLAEMVDDFSNYEAPEMLDNGDIIIRRKPEPLEEGEIEI